MTRKQKDFLNELDALLRKHNVDEMFATDGLIAFKSNDDILSFRNYDGDVFDTVGSMTSEYSPHT